MLEQLLARLSEMEALQKASDLDPLVSTRIISPGFTHLANLTEKITELGGGGRGRCLAMLPAEWSDYVAAAVNADAPLIALVRALLEERERNIDVDNDVEDSWRSWVAAQETTDAAIAAFLGAEVAK